MAYKVLNLLSDGGVGGIENLCKCISDIRTEENCFCCLFEEGVIYEEIKKNGNAVSLASYGSKKITIKRIKKLIDVAKGYDIIVVHHSALAIQLYYSLLKRIFPNKKYILVGHSCFSVEDYYNYNSKMKNSVRAWLQKHVLKISDRVIFVSKAGEKSYREAFDLPATKCRVVYNGVVSQTEYRKPMQRVMSKDHIFQIVFIGRLERVKGVHLLIEAMKELQTKYPVQLEVVGYGNEEKNLQNMCTSFDVAEIVHFAGMQRDIGSYLKQADIFVYPSIWEEVFGISLVEAMSYGVPCVANRVGGIPEIIDENKNGVLTKEKSGHALADAIESLIQDYYAGKADEMAEYCYKTAQFFSIDHTVEGLESCYKELLSKK
ncbi:MULTISPECIES: glycosyltransferase family 4 protein [Clostridia]|uniref:glycosyltransferase family 4 protein n=1 Tax=Clostridia TaxID=186801 RepID=UPI000E4F1E38|nr:MULTISPECIES: glycosyltransferase family 4 protein [Clostridia]RHV69960.1 glycosyltransferase family 1 protein [Roseburia sp. OM02-15]